MANAATLELARNTRMALAGSALTESQAKLYSQRLRRDMGGDGLRTFVAGDVYNYLDEALLLLECSLLESSNAVDSDWRQGVKRAAEILEWLSQSSLKPAGAPLHLLAAAAYQLAGYPAMALGHLRTVPDDQPFSKLLREFLRANFPSALNSVRVYWQRHFDLEITGNIDAADLTTYTFQHVIMCIGTICSHLRNGDNDLIQRALDKLERLAKSLRYSRDPYSALLARLTAASCQRFIDTSLWPQIERLGELSSPSAREALNQFARSAYFNRRALVWPAQAVGIERLRENNSFVLCTPTGSGKTTVATLAIVQALFEESHDDPFALLGIGNLVLYLVPSRALAAEVEGRLAEDLRGVASIPVIVTGLYGGVDWGPTDAWIQSDRATIVICTFEKADALIRYLGVVFLHRVKLVVIDEAHMVEQDPNRILGLADGTSRPYRLEQLGTRLLHARDLYSFRIVALSAVAAQAAPALARWIGGTEEGSPAKSSYRSTRQMLGRLEVAATGQFTIHYNLMDGRSLRFSDERPNESPYVGNPFSAVPSGLDPSAGPEKQMRAPTFWAALNLASQRPDGSKPTVLISLTQAPDAFAKDCADLIEGWAEADIPNYFTLDQNDPRWIRCLASAADYFTTESVEYRLLQKGVAVHHGKMPGLMSRRLKTLIDQNLVRVIIATSTLSEGVNIPVNYLLIPSVYRATSLFTLQEFSNLIGRAGRPGVATEGSALVVLPQRAYRRRGRRTVAVPNRQWTGYEQLSAQLEAATAAAVGDADIDQASSPLGQILGALRAAWVDLTGGGTDQEFSEWLEQTAVVGTTENAGLAYNYLDSLDAFLLAAIEEIETLRNTELTLVELEAELAAIWQRTYAFAAAREEERLTTVWLTRGRAIPTLYPDPAMRRRIYKTSLSPRSAATLLDQAQEIQAKLHEGLNYANFNVEERFEFIRSVIALIASIPSFSISTSLGRRRNFSDWPKILRWWLAKVTLERQPSPADITKWFDFVSTNFIYRGAWGLGSVIGVLMDGAEGEGPVRALEMDDWPRSGLPWIAFWMKELIQWGTLEPVAAYLLARGDAIDRPQAERDAAEYYDTLPVGTTANDALDPRSIRDWLERRRVDPIAVAAAPAEFNIAIELSRVATEYREQHLTVMPLERGEDGLIWINSAGHQVAAGDKPNGWPDDPSSFDFELDVGNEVVRGAAYRPHV